MSIYLGRYLLDRITLDDTAYLTGFYLHNFRLRHSFHGDDREEEELRTSVSHSLESAISNDSQSWVSYKVIDINSNRLLAFAFWKIIRYPVETFEQPGWNFYQDVVDSIHQEEQTQFPNKMSSSFQSQSMQIINSWGRGKSHIQLRLLCTGRGPADYDAGSLLVQAGNRMADEMGLQIISRVSTPKLSILSANEFETFANLEAAGPEAGPFMTDDKSSGSQLYHFMTRRPMY